MGFSWGLICSWIVLMLGWICVGVCKYKFGLMFVSFRVDTRFLFLVVGGMCKLFQHVCVLFLYHFLEMLYSRRIPVESGHWEVSIWW